MLTEKQQNILPKTYHFEFFGTRDDFMATLSQYPNHDHRFFYFNDYIVEIVDDHYYFGVQRSSHSGGYWFKPTVIEANHKLLFSGVIAYVDSPTQDSKLYQSTNKTENGCLFVLLLPIMIIVKLYVWIKNLTKMIKKQSVVKEETTEDQLYHLMEDLLGCKRK